MMLEAILAACDARYNRHIVNNVMIVHMEAIVRMIARNVQIIFILHSMLYPMHRNGSTIVHIWPIFIHVSILADIHLK